MVTRMRLERTRQRLTQLTLAYRSKVPVSEISRLENGRVHLPYAGHAARISKVLGIPAEKLTEVVEG